MWGESCYTVFQISLASLLLKKNILWYIWFLISVPQTVPESNFLRMWKDAGFSFENASTAAEGSLTPKALPAVITDWNRCLWDSLPTSLQCTRLFCLWYPFPVLNYIYISPFSLKEHKTILIGWPHPAIALWAQLERNSATPNYLCCTSLTGPSLLFQQQSST